MDIVAKDVIFYDIDGYPVKIGTTVGYLEQIWADASNEAEKDKYAGSYILLEWLESVKAVTIQEMCHESAQKGIYTPDPAKEPFEEYPSRLAAI